MRGWVGILEKGKNKDGREEWKKWKYKESNLKSREYEQGNLVYL